MRKNILYFMSCLLVASCGGKNFTVNQVENHAYLLIKGESKKEQLIIDSNSPIILGVDTKEYKLDDGIKASKLQIEEGTHTIKVLRNGNIIIQRNIYVTPGNTFEVNL